ncbi:metalloprotease [Colletotrichum costaricense]|uniref:Metalloprotease n=1 Tax=Colletotrichum costaricense TaxID=1209916 RepID=A0AAI9YWJ0_9PEZI|nr:metalloprotease [Colletotrichum costaricense]KAK1526988.1 metalloprotease [Colletotrichum costaricense]
MSVASTIFFPLCGTDGLQTGSEPIPAGNLIGEDGAPSNLAVNGDKFWPAGKKLHVRFLNGSLQVQKSVKYWAQRWEEFANISFKFLAENDKADADIRIGFRLPGYAGTWSYVGRDATKFVLSQKQPTMHFDEINDNSRKSEICHFVLHEFGHAIGCVHEHQANRIEWDRARVIADCLARYKWDEETTKQQILNLEPDLTRLTKTSFDPNSIMCYWFPPEWTVNRQSAPKNLNFSDKDKSFINRVYPFRTRNEGKLDIVPGIRTSENNVVALNSKAVDFTPPYDDPPLMALGLTQLDETNNANIRVRLGAETITEEGFKLNMDTWSDSVMQNAGATWLEFSPDERQYQVGSYSTLEDRDLGVPAKRVRDDATGMTLSQDITQIDFPRDAYAEGQPPRIITWLTGLDLGKDANWRIRCFARAVTHKGFELVIETWADTVCYSASASWVAHPADQEGVQSGKVSSSNVREWFPPVAKTKVKVNFAGNGAFEKTPKVSIGLSELDMDSAKKLRVKVFADKITPDGFIWHGETWDDSLLYTVGADWIAFG